MKPYIYPPKIIALFLSMSLALSLPAGVYAEPGRSTLRELQPLQNAGLEEQLRSALNPAIGPVRLPSFTQEQRTRFRRAFEIYQDRKRQELLGLPTISRNDLVGSFQRADVPVGSFWRIEGEEEAVPLGLFQQTKDLPFEIFFARLRDTQHWFAIKGANRDVQPPDKKGFSPLLFDLFVHNHPSQSKGTPAIGTDLVYSITEMVRGTARSFVVSEEGMTYYDGWDIRNSSQIYLAELNNEIIVEATKHMRLGLVTDYQKKLDQLHWETYPEIRATVEFKPWAAIGPEDFKTGPLDPEQMLQSPDPLTRGIAARFLRNLMEQETGVSLDDLFALFAQDPSQDVQEAALGNDHLLRFSRRWPAGPGANSLAPFLKSSNPRIRFIVLYRLLNPSYTGSLEGTLVEQILDAIEQEIRQRMDEKDPIPLIRLLHDFSHMEDRKAVYSQSLLRGIATRFGKQLRVEMQRPDADQYFEKGYSSLLARVLVEWNLLTAGLEEFLDQSLPVNKRGESLHRFFTERIKPSLNSGDAEIIRATRPLQELLSRAGDDDDLRELAGWMLGQMGFANRGVLAAIEAALIGPGRIKSEEARSGVVTSLLSFRYKRIRDLRRTNQFLKRLAQGSSAQSEPHLYEEAQISFQEMEPLRELVELLWNQRSDPAMRAKTLEMAVEFLDAQSPFWKDSRWPNEVWILREALRRERDPDQMFQLASTLAGFVALEEELLQEKQADPAILRREVPLIRKALERARARLKEREDLPLRYASKLSYVLNNLPKRFAPSAGLEEPPTVDPLLRDLFGGFFAIEDRAARLRFMAGRLREVDQRPFIQEDFLKGLAIFNDRQPVVQLLEDIFHEGDGLDAAQIREGIYGAVPHLGILGEFYLESCLLYASPVVQNKVIEFFKQREAVSSDPQRSRFTLLKERAIFARAEQRIDDWLNRARQSPDVSWFYLSMREVLEETEPYTQFFSLKALLPFLNGIRHKSSFRRERYGDLSETNPAYDRTSSPAQWNKLLRGHYQVTKALLNSELLTTDIGKNSVCCLRNLRFLEFLEQLYGLYLSWEIGPQAEEALHHFSLAEDYHRQADERRAKEQSAYGFAPSISAAISDAEAGTWLADRIKRYLRAIRNPLLGTNSFFLFEERGRLEIRMSPQALQGAFPDLVTPDEEIAPMISALEASLRSALHDRPDDLQAAREWLRRMAVYEESPGLAGDLFRRLRDDLNRLLDRPEEYIVVSINPVLIGRDGNTLIHGMEKGMLVPYSMVMSFWIGLVSQAYPNAFAMSIPQQEALARQLYRVYFGALSRYVGGKGRVDWGDLKNLNEFADSLRSAGMEEPNAVPILLIGPTALGRVKGLRGTLEALQETKFAEQILLLPDHLPEGTLPEHLASRLVRILQLKGAAAFSYGDSDDPVLKRVTELLKKWGVSSERGRVSDLSWLVARIQQNIGPVSIQQMEDFLRDFFDNMAGLEEAA